MARTMILPDAGNYTRPGQIQAPDTTWVDNGQGGNANAGQWTTVRSPWVHLYSGNFGRGVGRAYKYGQLYPEARHWAEMRYSHDVTIDATMTLLLDGRRYQILGAIDVDLAHVSTLLALVEYQAKGSA
jgi:hypothetical protein